MESPFIITIFSQLIHSDEKAAKKIAYRFGYDTAFQLKEAAITKAVDMAFEEKREIKISHQRSTRSGEMIASIEISKADGSGFFRFHSKQHRFLSGLPFWRNIEIKKSGDYTPPSKVLNVSWTEKETEWMSRFLDVSPKGEVKRSLSKEERRKEVLAEIARIKENIIYFEDIPSPRRISDKINLKKGLIPWYEAENKIKKLEIILEKIS